MYNGNENAIKDIVAMLLDGASYAVIHQHLEERGFTVSSHELVKIDKSIERLSNFIRKEQ